MRHKTAIVDVIWENEDTVIPRVTVDLVDTHHWKAAPEVKAATERHLSVLSALDSAIMYRHPKDAPLLTSKNMRLGETTIAKLLCTAIRESLSFGMSDNPVDCTILQAGMIRGKKDYPEGHFTLASLRLEFPMSKDVVIVEMPGRVIAAAIKDTRADEGKVERARYLQTCDNVVVAPRGEEVISIGGEPFSPDKLYKVAIRRELLTGLDSIGPLVEYANSLPDGPPPSDAGRPVKPVVLDYFMRRLWSRLPDFDEIDENGDGVLTHEEVKEAYVGVFGWDADGDGTVTEDERTAVELLIQSLIGTLDVDDNGVIDCQEYERFKAAY